MKKARETREYVFDTTPYAKVVFVRLSDDNTPEATSEWAVTVGDANSDQWHQRTKWKGTVDHQTAQVVYRAWLNKEWTLERIYDY